MLAARTIRPKPMKLKGPLMLQHETGRPKKLIVTQIFALVQSKYVAKGAPGGNSHRAGFRSAW